MHYSFSKSTRAGVLALTALLAIATGSASAQTQTQSFSINAPLETLGSTGSFSLPDFDTALGSLQSIDLTLTINSCFSIQVYNSSSHPENFLNASLSLNGSVQGPGITLGTSVTSIIPSGTAGPGTNTYSPSHATTVTNGSVDSNLFNLWENQAGDLVNLTYIKGNPNFQGTDVAGDSLFFGGKVRGDGKVTVSYIYLSGTIDPSGPPAVPEPSAKYLSAIAAVAMLALVIGRRRRHGVTGEENEFVRIPMRGI